jgi:23S rRNA (cytosine1962-C5)-methyltransferase
VDAPAVVMPAPDYELLDFGRGRKLERFGEHVLDRPAPATASLAPAQPEAWRRASARFERGGGAHGVWQPPGAVPRSWGAVLCELNLEVRATPAGGVGVFPEQLALVAWLERTVARLAAQRSVDDAPRVLNLFAHTGLLTLVAARAGARVAHVDASRPAVAWARRNAGRSGLADRPIRWLVDDARAFTRRELRRGRRYDGVVLDPPSFGHGPDGGSWRLDAGLTELLEDVAALTAGRPGLLLLTAHATGLRADDLLGPVRQALGDAAALAATAASLEIASRDGRRLPAGLVVRCEAP